MVSTHLAAPLSAAQGGTATSYGAPAYFIQLPNDPTTGTVAYRVVTQNSAGNVVVASTSQASGLIGVCIAGCGTSGTATIQVGGFSSCTSLGGSTVNDYAGTALSGECQDLGAAPSSTTQIVGRYTATQAGAGTHPLSLFPGEQHINTPFSLSGYSGPVGVTGTTGNGSDQITKVSVNGVYNCVAYGADPTGTIDSTNAIQTAINAAEAAAINNPVSAPVVYCPQGKYKTGGTYPNYRPITFQGPSLSGTAVGLTFQGDGPYTTGFNSVGTMPTFFVEPINYATTYLGTGADAWTSAPLVGVVGASLNWGTGTPSQRYINLKDLNQSNGANAIGEEAGLINGIQSFDWRAFVQYPSSGLTNGDYYYMAQAAASDGVTNTTVLDIHMIAGSTPTLSGTINMSDGSHTVSASAAGFTAGVVHVIEFNVDSVTHTVNFFLDGTKITTSVSIASGATVVSPPSVQFLIGESNLGIWSDNTGVSNSEHWIGQIYGMQISKVAYNVSNYTAPTAAFTSDSNTWLLLDCDHINDVWITTDTLIGGSGALAFHAENLAGGNNGVTIKGLSTLNGAYGVFNIGALYGRLQDVNLYGTESGFHTENNSYGWLMTNVNLSTKSYGQSAFEAFHNSGHINVSGTLNMTTGAYGGILADSNFMSGEAFSQGANSYNVAMFSIYGDTPYDKFTLTNTSFDNEGGSPLACFQVSGTGSVSIMNADCQTIGTNPPIDWNPGNSGGNLQVIGSSFETNGGAPSAIVNYLGSNVPTNPAYLLNDSVNNVNFNATTIPPCSKVNKCVVKPALPIPLTGATPTLTVLSGGDIDADTYTETLGASTTLTLPASTAVAVNQKVFRVTVTQPTGSNNYTFALSAGSGMALTYPTSGGCPSLPSMPTGTNHSLILSILENLNPTSPEYDVVYCGTSGS